jgi:hypothetical protein
MANEINNTDLSYEAHLKELENFQSKVPPIEERELVKKGRKATAGRPAEEPEYKPLVGFTCTECNQVHYVKGEMPKNKVCFGCMKKIAAKLQGKTNTSL